MNLPLISIIVPNYNHYNFLHQRFDSIFNQTFQNFEVILLDDASIDNSVEILEKYRNHPKVSHFIVNKVNSGSPFKQWQRGINLAKGDYIWIAESDDYCENTFLETLLPMLINNLALVYCASSIVNNKEEIIGRHKWADALDKKRWEYDYTFNGKQEVTKYLKYRNTITNASAVLFRRDFVLNMEFPIHMKFCGDWYLWIEILKKGNIAYVSKTLNYFRRHGNTTKGVKSFTLELQRFKEYFMIIQKNSNIIDRLKQIKNYDWILDEWFLKKQHFGSFKIFSLKIPLDLFIRYIIKYKGL